MLPLTVGHLVSERHNSVSPDKKLTGYVQIITLIKYSERGGRSTCKHIHQTIFLNDIIRPLQRTNHSGIRKPDGGTYLVSQNLRVLDVQFIEGFNVIAGKRYRHQKDVLPAPLTKPFDSLVCLRPQPGHRTNLRARRMNADRDHSSRVSTARHSPLPPPFTARALQV